jgi:hypothetical protein
MQRRNERDVALSDGRGFVPLIAVMGQRRQGERRG